MVWPIMGDACRRSIHLKDGVEASQRVRRSGRSAPSSTLAFNEQSGNCSGPEVGFEEIRLDLPQARFWTSYLIHHPLMSRFDSSCGGAPPGLKRLSIPLPPPSRLAAWAPTTPAPALP